MIKVTYDRDEHTVTVKGHAQSGEAGHDLVCSAASILVYALARNVEKMCEDKKRVRRPVIELAEGNAKISCSPVHGMNVVTTLVFDSVCTGFELLSVSYPDNLEYFVKG